MKKRMLPMLPPGKKTDKEKNPFQILMKIKNEVHPQTGQMAINSEITLITPTAAPADTNLGLYSSIELTPMKFGSMKVV